MNAFKLRLSLLELKTNALRIAADATDDKHKWITTETGSHVQLDEDGNILAGMGGKFTGKNIKDVHGTKELTKYETNAETEARQKNAAAPSLSEKHEKMARKLAESSAQSFFNSDNKTADDYMDKARQHVKDTYNNLSKIKKVIHNPDFSVKDLKIGDEVNFPRNGINGGFDGTISKVYRTKFDVDGEYMGKPMTLEKMSLMPNGIIKSGDTLIYMNEDKYKTAMQTRKDLGI